MYKHRFHAFWLCISLLWTPLATSKNKVMRKKSIFIYFSTLVTYTSTQIEIYLSNYTLIRHNKNFTTNSCKVWTIMKFALHKRVDLLIKFKIIWKEIRHSNKININLKVFLFVDITETIQTILNEKHAKSTLNQINIKCSLYYYNRKRLPKSFNHNLKTSYTCRSHHASSSFHW